MKKLIKYFSISRCASLQVINHRLSYVFSVMTQIIFIIFQYYLWRAIFNGHEVVGSYTWEDMKIYIVINFILSANFYAEWRVSSKILDGSIAMDLIKPIRFDRVNLAQTSGMYIFEFIVSFMISIGIVLFAFDLTFTNDVIVWILFIVSLINAFFLKFCFIYIAGLTAFWTHNVTGVTWARIAITNLFSGALIPLSMFPVFFQDLSRFLPFGGMLNTPLIIILEHVNSNQSLYLLIAQIIWGFILWNIAKLLLHLGLRKLTINGG